MFGIGRQNAVNARPACLLETKLTEGISVVILQRTDVAPTVF